MGRESDVGAFFSERITIAPNAVYGITAMSGQLATSIKLLSGGTLEVGGPTLHAYGQTTVNQTAGSLYPMGANEIISANSSGMIYLYATGATCVVAVLRGRSGGPWS